jgi:hypothetical protein
VKTALDPSDHLLARTKALAKKRGTTLRSVAEEGLKRVLDADESAPKPELKPATFKGRGLSPEFREAPWKDIRDTAYGER